MRYLILFLFIPMLSLSQTTADLEGTSWKFSNFEIKDAPSELQDFNQPCLDKARLTFKEGYVITKSYSGVNCDQVEVSQKIEYQLKDTLITSRDTATGETETMKIASFSKEKMILHQTTDGQTVIITLEKVN